MDLPLNTVFDEIAALLVVASVTGFLGLWLRQPLIVAFIAVGILVGPGALGIAQSLEHIELLAQIGVSLLLFMVGLQLDVKLVRTVGTVALMTGLGQVFFTAAVGFLICLGLGMGSVESIYVAVALTFSSTIIIVKLLSDKRELDSLHGRIALGFLIVQDIVVVVAMIVLSASGIGREGEDQLADIAMVVLRGAVLLAFIALFIRYVANRLARRLLAAPELLICFSIGWATLLSALGEHAGLSMELGGLLAGVSLASTPYREAIAARLVGLRDFMLLFFFIGLGARLDLSTIGAEVPSAIVLSIFVLIGNPLIVLIIMGAMGYRSRTGFLAGLTVAQISEFSLVFIAMGLALGDVGASAVGLVTLVGLVTIALSTYMILYSHALYRVAEPLLGLFERKVPFREPPEVPTAGAHYDVILVGLGRYGGAIMRGLVQRGIRVLGIDFDPAVVKSWQESGVDARYGDATDPELLESLPLGDVRWVVHAVPTPNVGPSVHDARPALVHALRSRGFSGGVALTAHDARDAARLRQAGADLVLMPFVDASRHAAERIADALRPAPAGEGGP